MMDTSNSPVVLITGASSGIGLASCQLFHRRGYRVVASARKVQSIPDTVCSLKLRLDVTKPQEVVSAVDTVVKTFGRVDLVINNAGYGQRGTVEDVGPQWMNESFEVNVYGAMRVIQAVLPLMREARRGRIINVGSIVGRSGMPLMGVYCATKAALASLTDSLRLEVAPFNIDVVLIEPGPVRTAFSQHAVQRSKAVWENVHSPYAPYYQGGGTLSYDRFSTTADGVAHVIWRAARASHPKSRYQVPFSSRLFVLLFPALRHWGFDQMMIARFKTMLGKGSPSE